jgi:AraC-like DNA-binding protein
MSVLADTSTVAPEDRFQLWSEAHPRLFFPLDVRCQDAEPFRGRILGHRLGPLDLFSVRGDASAVRRTQRTIGAFDPESLTVLMAVSGRCRVQQGDRDAVISAGEISSYETSRPFSIGAPQPFELLLFAMPRALLGAGADAAGHRTASRITSESGPGALAAPFLRDLWRGLQDERIGRQDAHLADAVVAIARALHAGTKDGVAERPAAASATLVPRIKEHIEHHLHELDLGPGAIARAHFVSVRYLHMLFAREGVTVSGWVRRRRLECCRRDLADPALAGEPIATIAARWGMLNHAHFSRIFREAYGCTPREARNIGAAGSPRP